MIAVTQKGSFKKLDRFLEYISKKDYMAILNRYGRRGVEALKEATPKDTGKTSESWSYVITHEENGYVLNWYNSNTNNGINIALLIQMGHGTRYGTYVQGIDYINPALQNVINDMIKEIWEEVRSA